MPAYNAEKTLRRTYDEVMAQGIVDQLIVVDDASNDATVQIASQLPHTIVRVHEKNRGYGGNQKTCYRAALEAGADIVVMVHPDYQYTPKLMPAMVALIGGDVYPCVLGSRILGGGALKGGMPIWKYVANRGLTLTENWLLGSKLSEYHTGYRAFTRGAPARAAARAQLGRLRLRQPDARPDPVGRARDRGGHLPDGVLRRGVVDQLRAQRALRVRLSRDRTRVPARALGPARVAALPAGGRLRPTRIGVAAGLAALVAAAYSGVVELGFLTFDDDGYVTKNPMVLGGLTPRAVWAAFSQFHAQNWHPLTWLSHMLDVSLYGLWPAGHHLTSVALHAANAVLVFLVLERLTGATWRAAFAAALFAVHPLRVESVAWIAERKDVLSTCFGLAALYAWSFRSYWASVGLFAASLCAKPMLVTFPFLLLVLDWWPLRRLDSPRALVALAREKWPFFALSLGSCVVTLFAQREAMGYAPLPLRLANSLAAFQEYLYRVVDPRALYPMYLYRGQLRRG